MEKWMEMAEMVADQTLIHVNNTAAVVQAIDVAHSKFAVCADALRRTRLGLPIGVHDVFPVGVGIAFFLMIAVREITRLVALHAGVGHAFAICAEHVGLRGNARRWQSWESHRADVAAHADMTLRRLRSAASHNTASRDVMLVYRSIPRGSPLSIAWLSAAEQHVRRAADEVSMARDAVERLRSAVVLEYSDAWILLYH